MTDILMPPSLRPESMTWTLERNEARFESPISRTVQRVARGGDRWRCTLQFPQLVDEQAGALMAWLDQISRADNAGLIPVAQNLLSGESASSNFAERQMLWTDRAPSLDWTSVNLLQSIFTRSGEAVVCAAGLVAPAQASAYRNFTVTPGLPYEVIFDIPPQVYPGGYAIYNPSGTNVNGRNVTRYPGQFRHLVTAGSTFITISMYPADGEQSFQISYFRRISVARVFMNESAVAAGATNMNVFGGVSTVINRAMAAGQFFNVHTTSGLELKRTHLDVDLIGQINLGGNNVSHIGRCVFEPPLRGSLPINSAISTVSPVCRMVLAQASASSSISAPIRHGITIDLVEDVT